VDARSLADAPIGADKNQPPNGVESGAIQDTGPVAVGDGANARETAVPDTNRALPDVGIPDIGVRDAAPAIDTGLDSSSTASLDGPSPGADAGANPRSPDLASTSASAVIGPAGGVLEITDPSSPGYGIAVELPAGALQAEVTLSVSALSEEDVLSEVRGWPKDVVFFGGVRISADRATQMLKPYTVKLPNSRGATSSTELLVGRIADIDATPPSEIVFEGLAYLGSIDFFPSQLGSFAVLSPVNGLGLVGGKFTTQAGVPIAGALVVASGSIPFVSITNKNGQYVIPAGQPQNMVGIIASTLPNGVAGTPATNPSLATGSTLLPEFPWQLWPPAPLVGPQPIEDLLPDFVQEIIDLVDGNHVLPDPPSECKCDPPPTPPYFRGREFQPDNDTFRMFPFEFVQTLIRSGDHDYDEHLVVWGDFPMALADKLWSGDTVAVFRVYSSSANNVAYFDPTWPGRLFAAQPGDANISATLLLATTKDCSDQVPRKILCPATLYAAGKVAVRCSYQGIEQPWWNPADERCEPCPPDAPTWNAQQEQCTCTDGSGTGESCSSVKDGGADAVDGSTDAGCPARMSWDAKSGKCWATYSGTMTSCQTACAPCTAASCPSNPLCIGPMCMPIPSFFGVSETGDVDFWSPGSNPTRSSGVSNGSFTMTLEVATGDEMVLQGTVDETSMSGTISGGGAVGGETITRSGSFNATRADFSASDR